MAAAPVGAEDTDTSFELLAGTLSVSAPVSADLGSTGVDNLTLVGQLGDVTVTDDRGSLVAVWTTTVSSTDFTTGGASADETISNAQVAYSSGAATGTSGTGTFVPGAIASLALPGVGGAWAGGVGNNSATWTPTVTVTLLPGRIAGTYTGTITHSVA